MASDRPARRAPGTDDDRPKELEVAFWLWIAVPVGTAILVVIGAAYGQSGDDGSNTGPIPAAAGVAILLFGLLQLAVQFTFPSLMWRGKNWARVTLTVIAVFGVLGTLIGYVIDPLLLPWWCTLPLLILYAAAPVMSYRPAVNAWFRAWG